MHKLISFVVAESHRLKKGAEIEQKPLESAPPYYTSSIPQQYAMSEEKMKIEGYDNVKFLVRAYPPENILVEASVEVDDIFSEKTFKLREQLVDACQKISRKHGGTVELSEEYSIALVSGYSGDPEQFLSKRAQIASFLKSEIQKLDEQEIDYTISKQIKYANNDLVIVDWDGAFVFDTEGKIDDIIDLFQTANLQLLRFRTLDRELDDRLRKVTKFANLPETSWSLFSWKKNGEIAKAFKEVISVRTKAIADFEAIDRDIKMIGDWYSARLYELASKKFKLDEWKSDVKEKLDSLEDIYTIVAENFSVSRNEALELLQIILFFVLQAGWFVILILEFLYFTKK